MKGLNRKFAISAIAVGLLSLAALSGCGKTETASAPAMSPIETQPMAGTGVNGLLRVVDNTKTAVEAGDFSKAKTAFEQFEEEWKPVEDGIKAKSPQGYEKIEDSMDQVAAALNASDRQKGLTTLQALADQINSAK